MVAHPLTVHFRNGVIYTPFAPSGVPLTSKVPLARKSARMKNGDWWVAPIPDSAQVISWADAQGVPVQDDVREYADQQWLRELEAMQFSSAASLPAGADPVPITGLTSTLLPLQEVGVYVATHLSTVSFPSMPQTHRGLIVADDTGLGKTIEALSMTRAQGYEAQRAIIICPTSLVANWGREMDVHFAPGTFTPWVATTKTPSPVPDGVDVVLIGWDVLVHWAQTLQEWKPDAVFADEGQYGKSGKERIRKVTSTIPKKGPDGRPIRDAQGNNVMTKVQTDVKDGGSKRATAFIEMGVDVASRGGLVVALTGTPILNRPAELEPLLEYTGVLRCFLSSTAFKERYCGPRTMRSGGGVKTLYIGHSNLIELNRRLTSSGHYLRRTKEILVREGVLQRKFVDGVDVLDKETTPNPWVINAEPDEMEAYFAIQRRLERFFAARARELAQARGVSVEAVQRQMVSEGHQHLKKIAELRVAAAKIKVPHVVAKVREVVASGEKVVIGAHHRSIVDAYADSFTGLKIQGGMTPKKIEQAKAAFNETPVTEHPVLVLSIEAGKTGHTLCKQNLNGVGPSCAFMTLAEQVWTPGDDTQVQDRIWRLGQEREVRIINALLSNSIDYEMYAQRRKKYAVMNSVIDGTQEVASEGRDAGRVVWGLAQAGIMNPTSD